MLKSKTKQIVLRALSKDIERRYISVVSLQSDGRLELDSACLRVLNPTPNEEFVLIDDSSSIIIARKPIAKHENKVIGVISYGSGSGDKVKWRLRLSQEPLRILLTCKVGFRAFKYGDEIALEAEPAIPDSSLESLECERIEDLAPYVLRSARSILHLDCLASSQPLDPSSLDFRLLGQYWLYKYHQDVLDPQLRLLRCSLMDCDGCTKNLPIVRTICWFPAVGYDRAHHARPTILSFRLPYTEAICSELLKECTNWSTKKFGTYPGKKLYRLSDGDLTINLLKQDRGLTINERGLMKIALRELEMYVVNFEARRES